MVELIKTVYRPTIYLAGPIGGLTWDEATGWREQAKDLLRPCGTLSPLRDMNGVSLRDSCFVIDGGRTANAVDPDRAPFDFDKLFQRDYIDVHTCDAMLINMIGAKKQSVGTICEIAWGYRRGIPMFVAMEPGNINQNPFITPQIRHLYVTLADAINGLRNHYGFQAYDAGSVD